MHKLKSRAFFDANYLTSDVLFEPSPYTFEPNSDPTRHHRHGLRYDCDHSPLAVFDTLEDTLPEEGGPVMCIEWINWGRTNRTTWALIVASVDEKRDVYRRIGWMQYDYCDDLEGKLQDIILV